MPDRPAAQRENQSVRKAIGLLRAATETPGETVSQLARSTGLPRATALRMIEAMVEEGFLRRLAGRGGIVPGPDLLSLARTAVPAAVSEAARVPMQELAARLRESITLAINHADGSVEIVRQADGPLMIGLANWVGRPFALHASASGKIALAYGDERRLEDRLRRPLERCATRTICDAITLRVELERVRERGHAEIVDELEDGLAAISVPLRIGSEVVASVSVSGPSARFGARERQAALPRLRQAAATIEAALARRG